MDTSPDDVSENLANELDDKMQICTDDAPEAKQEPVAEKPDAETDTVVLTKELLEEEDDEDDPDYEYNSDNSSSSESEDEEEWETTDDERDARLKEIEAKAGLEPLPEESKEQKEDHADTEPEAVATDEDASDSDSSEEEAGEEKESLTLQLLKESKNDDLSDDDAEYVDKDA